MRHSFTMSLCSFISSIIIKGVNSLLSYLIWKYFRSTLCFFLFLLLLSPISYENLANSILIAMLFRKIIVTVLSSMYCLMETITAVADADTLQNKLKKSNLKFKIPEQRSHLQNLYSSELFNQ